MGLKSKLSKIGKKLGNAVESGHKKALDVLTLGQRSEINDFVKNKVPGGWLTVGAGALTGGAALSGGALGFGMGPLVGGGGLLGGGGAAASKTPLFMQSAMNPAVAGSGGGFLSTLGKAGAAVSGFLGNPLVSGALGGVGAAIDYNQSAKGYRQMADAMDPMFADPTQTVTGDYNTAVSKFGVLNGPMGGEATASALNPYINTAAGRYNADKYLGGFSNTDYNALSTLAAGDLGPGWDKALQFRNQAIERAMAARGMNTSTNTVGALADEGQKFMLDQFNNRLGQLTQERNFQYGVAGDRFNAAMGDVTRDIGLSGSIAQAKEQGVLNRLNINRDLTTSMTRDIAAEREFQRKLRMQQAEYQAGPAFLRGGIASGVLDNMFGAAGYTNQRQGG